VADKLCTFLGHPKDDRGLEIPEGKCCSTTLLQEEGLMSLSSCGIGEEVVIVSISTDKHLNMHKLTALELFPGTKVRLHQKAPTLIIELPDKTVAIDMEIAKEILVRKA
ncbi:MAG: FeoA family protein, partial [bacterium]